MQLNKNKMLCRPRPRKIFCVGNDDYKIVRSIGGSGGGDDEIDGASEDA